VKKGNTGNPGQRGSNEKGQVKDKFARKMLANRDLAIEFFNAFLPAINPGGDWSSLREEPGSFISDEFKGSYSDVLHSFKQGEEQNLVYLLIEHKSQSERWTVLYLLGVMCRIWDKWREKHGASEDHLPLIVPVILHQSSRPWSAPLSLSDYFPESRKLSPCLPNFHATLVDLAKVNVDLIETWFLKTVVALMKAVREGSSTAWLLEHFTSYAGMLAARYGQGMLRFMLTYLAEESEGSIDISTISQIADKVADNKVRTEVMTWAESLRDEARMDGLELGESQGILMGSINSYREVLGLNPLPREQLKQKSEEDLARMLADLKLRLQLQSKKSSN
jgi:hypothetical protein